MNRRADYVELMRLAEASLQIARAIEAQAHTQREAAERLYAQAALMELRSDVAQTDDVAP